MTRRLITALAIAALVVASCGGDDDDSDDAAPSDPTTTTTTTTGNPVGIIAIGHSGLTAQNSGGPAAENSWATGTSPEINSIYVRMIEIRPETEGNVANTAGPSAPASQLIPQARRALETVPNPALVIIQSVEADLTCDGDVATNAATYGATIAEALEFLTTETPGSRILVVGHRGRPDIEAAEQTAAEVPGFREGWGDGPCALFNAAGEIVPENFETLTSVIEAYDAAQAEACAAIPLCVTDEGALAAFIDGTETLSSDLNHPNVVGLTEIAELEWPAVEALLTESGNT